MLKTERVGKARFTSRRLLVNAIIVYPLSIRVDNYRYQMNAMNVAFIFANTSAPV